MRVICCIPIKHDGIYYKPGQWIDVDDIDPIREFVVTVQKEEAESIEAEEDFSSKTIKELRDIAKVRGVEKYSTMNKKTLIQALEGL